MFLHKNVLYLWGGDSSNGIDDVKLYSLDLSPKEGYHWQVVKTKGSLRPSPREQFGGVVYRGKYYIFGGYNFGSVSDEFWCLNLSNFKWSPLKKGPVRRHAHRMWAARGKIFVFGGRSIGDGKMNDGTNFDYTVEDFDAYDIEKKSWIKLPIFGDSPYDISEYCCLPVFGERDETEEPSAVIVWGGYSEFAGRKFPTLEEEKKKYGDVTEDFRIPYRRRLLRYDINLNIWTLLSPTSEVLPKAESYAAELECENGQIKLLIGGGYGYTQNSLKKGEEWDKATDADPM